VDRRVEVIRGGTGNKKAGRAKGRSMINCLCDRERVKVLVERNEGGGNFLPWRDVETRKMGGLVRAQNYRTTKLDHLTHTT
jgi:hypothetical protein